jgi:hypothetical protein
VAEDCDIGANELANYKGIYAKDNGDEGDQKYTCPITGAHFEFRDLCKRISKVYEKRSAAERTTSQVKKTLLAPPKAKLKVKEVEEEEVEEPTQDDSSNDLSAALEKMARLGQETNIGAVLNSGVDATTSLLAADFK